jgi:hypothetical protein
MCVNPEPSPLEPDTKDWTWVLERPCDECGFDASAYDRPRSAGLPQERPRVVRAPADPAAGVRSRPDRWSTLEYACHVHDVHQIYHDRVSLMLAEHDPLFANWTRTARPSWVATPTSCRPSSVPPGAAAYAIGDLYDSVPPLSWQRRGRRSDGHVFTIESLARYQLHDVVHHLHDVRHAARSATIRRTTRPRRLPGAHP